MKYLKQNAGCIFWCTRWARRPHADKLLSTTLYTPYLAEIWKNLMPRSFTLKVPQAKISVFNIYRPSSSSAYSVSDNTFLHDFNEFLSFAATTPH